MSSKANTIWAFAITSVALFMVSLDNLVVSTAIPVIRTDLDASLEQLDVDRQRLHPDVRGAPAHRRGARRPVRPEADVRDRADDLHARLGRGSARPERRDPQPLPRRPGARRRDRDAAHADDPERSRPGRAARARARCLGRDRRARDRARAARRRSGRRGCLVAVDLLAQRPDRARARPALAAAPPGEPRDDHAARPAGPRARQRRALRDRLGPDPGERSRAGRARRSSGRSSSARSSSPRSSCGSCAPSSRCSRCGSSAAARSASRTRRRCSCSSGCSARSSCSRSSSRRCRATGRSTPGSGSSRGRSRRCSSRPSPERCPTGSTRG